MRLKLCYIYLQLKEYEGKETAQLVDRYKFLDLYPCTSVELRSIGYTEVSCCGLSCIFFETYMYACICNCNFNAARAAIARRVT